MSSSLIQAKLDDTTIVPLRADVNNYLITSSSIIPENGAFMLGSPNGNAIQADSAPKAAISPDGYKGWYYINDDGKGGVNLKMNWYFYDGTEHNYLVGDIREITATVSLRHPMNKPFFVLYTKTGSSRIYTTNELMIEGEKVLFYFAETGYIPQNNENLRLVRLTATIDNGVVIPSLPVQYLSIHSNSTDPTGEFEVVVENVGFRIVNITCNYELLTPASGGGVESDVNIISSIDLNVENTQLDKLTFDSANKLEVNANIATIDSKNTLNVNLKTSEIVLPVSIGSTVPVSNDALTAMTFTTSSVGSKLLNVFTPELTNVHIIGQENDLSVVVVGGVSITPTTTSSYSWTEADFAFYSSGNPIPLGSFSPMIDLSTKQNGFILWGYGVKNAGSHSHLVLQLSNDGFLWFDTIYNVQVVDADTPFTLVCDFPCKWMRTLVRVQPIDSIYLNMAFK